MLLRDESVSTRDQQEKSSSACPVMPYWAVLGAARKAQGHSGGTQGILMNVSCGSLNSLLAKQKLLLGINKIP
ncbi:hypothetical protein TURU_096054 [Turdus rufiventris]|nr:hypothetical protein TURU_096054 [Turdus rufiventris]